MTASLRTEGITISAGSRILASGIELDIGPGDRVGVVGDNGCGKSTLLQVLAGLQPPAEGVVIVSPSTAAIGYLPQLRSQDCAPGTTVAQVLSARTGVAQAQADLESAAFSLAEGGSSEPYVDALARWESLGGADLEQRAERVLADIGLAVDLDRRSDTLSGGEAARLGLAAILLSSYDVLLLDEPTNDLDSAGLAWLRAFVTTSSSAIAVVSHDRQFLADVCTGILEFDPALERVSFFHGGYDAWVVERSRARAHAEDDYQRYEERRADLAAQAQHARESAGRGSRHADRAYRSGRVDKVTRDRMRDGATGGGSRAGRLERALDSMDEVRQPRRQWQLRLGFAGGSSAADALVTLRNAVADQSGFPLAPVDLTIHQGERVLLRGANGSGKSTLLRMITGDLRLRSGTRGVGVGVHVGVMDQLRSYLTTDRGRTAVAAVRDRTGLTEEECRTLLAKFGITVEEALRSWGSLSEGERTRVMLSVLTVAEDDLLVLDEPTNHCDINAIEALQSALMTYPGALVVVSHDSRFVDALSWTRIIDLDSGRLVEASTP